MLSIFARFRAASVLLSSAGLVALMGATSAPALAATSASHRPAIEHARSKGHHKCSAHARKRTHRNCVKTKKTGVTTTKSPATASTAKTLSVTTTTTTKTAVTSPAATKPAATTPAKTTTTTTAKTTPATTPTTPATTTPATTTPAATTTTAVVSNSLGSTQSNTATSSSVPFLATGPWNAPTPSNAPLDPNSAAIVANIAAQVQTYYGHAALNTSSYSAPIYTVAANQPTVNMSWNNCQNKPHLDPNFAADLQNVPIPATAVPSGGSDAEMVIYQPSTDTEWEFWKASETNGTWSACWGGKITSVSQNPGIFATGFGATASGLPMLGFLIRVSDLQSGSINHAINLELPHIRAYTWSWPANRTDGGSTDPTTPMDGERFILPASLNLATLNLSPGALMIAKAMQTYGAIVTDTSGAVSVQAEDPRPYMTGGAANPYSSYFNNQPQYSWLQKIPFGDLEAVAANYGEPATS